MMNEYYLISKKIANDIADDVEKIMNHIGNIGINKLPYDYLKRALHNLHSGLNKTDCVPDDFKDIEEEGDD